ncbi:MAG: Bax inhibitor-1/YccA family protein [Pseudomonadota bacterium]
MEFGNLNQQTGYTSRQTVDQAQLDEGLRKFMLSVYNYMGMGLLISGLVAYAVAEMPALNALFYNTVDGRLVGYTGLGMVAMFAPLGILLFAMFGMRNASAQATQIMYWAFVGLQGIGLAVLLQIYTDASVARAFFTTAAAFGALSIYGYTTNRNLSAFGSFLIMGVIGLILASLINLFFPSAMMTFVISVAGVLIFAGLIAYDTQRLKNEYVAGMGHEAETKVAVWGALSLYINFINLMQFLLMFLGNRE